MGKTHGLGTDRIYCKRAGYGVEIKNATSDSRHQRAFFVGDSTISYGIVSDSAAHNSLLCYPKIESFLKS